MMRGRTVDRDETFRTDRKDDAVPLTTELLKRDIATLQCYDAINAMPPTGTEPLYKPRQQAIQTLLANNDHRGRGQMLMEKSENDRWLRPRFARPFVNPDRQDFKAIDEHCRQRHAKANPRT